MQKDMDDVIEHLEMQQEDLRSKFSFVPLRPASELPLTVTPRMAILYCLWLRLHKSQNLGVWMYANTMGQFICRSHGTYCYSSSIVFTCTEFDTFC